MNTILQPTVLRWARLRAGLSEADLADKIGVSKFAVAAWEANGSLEIKFIERFAAATKTPLGFLFLAEPPKESLPVSDFRTVNAKRPAIPSRRLLSIIYQCQRRQDWYRQYLISNGARPLPFVGKFTPDAPIEQVAKEISATIKLGPEYNQDSEKWEDAMRRSIESIEDAGILINKVGFAENYTHNKLSVKEFRGFALSDAFAPLIFVNGADAPAAQMFTMAHEIVHIWLGESGVSNLNQTYSGAYKIEQFCNSVAAEILVPDDALKGAWKAGASAKNEVSRLAKRFRVSRIVMARRAKDANRISDAVYKSFYRTEVKAASKEKNGGGNFYYAKPYEASRRLSVALIRDARNGRTMFREAMDLLGIASNATFQKYAEHLKISL